MSYEVYLVKWSTFTFFRGNLWTRILIINAGGESCDQRDTYHQVNFEITEENIIQMIKHGFNTDKVYTSECPVKTIRRKQTTHGVIQYPPYQRQ